MALAGKNNIATLNDDDIFDHVVFRINKVLINAKLLKKLCDNTKQEKLLLDKVNELNKGK